jgi:hypothetical protein
MCSLNLIEPHLRPDPRRIHRMIPARTATILATFMYASYCFIGICANPRYFQRTDRVSEPTGLLTERSDPKPAEQPDITLDSQEVQLQRS